MLTYHFQNLMSQKMYSSLERMNVNINIPMLMAIRLDLNYYLSLLPQPPEYPKPTATAFGMLTEF